MSQRPRYSATVAALATGTALLGFMPMAQAQPITLNAKSKVTILVPQQATAPERTAAQELDNYLTKATGGDFTVQSEGSASKFTSPAIYVGKTQFAQRAGVAVDKLGYDEWRIKSHNKNLILAGSGTRGTLYATYRFLEDNVGVRWWNPWEETMPGPKALTLPVLDKRGKPSFSYRDTYMLYGNDEGRFAIRSRLNRDGDAPVGAQFGGSRNYGPPYHVHTFFKILSPNVYYQDHPDWFIVPSGGIPSSGNSQLAMSNPAMRQEFLKLLREIIRTSHKDAKEKGLPAPDVFSVSQEDNMVKFATPADKELLEKNDGAESAILLEFINYLADGIKDEFPDVYIDTLAYFSGEKVPKTVRPRDNVIIRLTDTTSNQILPITHPRNKVFHDNVVNWGKITKNLRVWDYAVTYTYPGLPMPTANTYAPDYRFMRANNVVGVFTEHEYPITADMRDFKVWVQCKLLEDPNRDYEALKKEFTDGFYGPAGVHVRRYITALENEAKRVGEADKYEDISWFVPAGLYNYLSIDFIIKSNDILDQAEKAAGENAILQRRVRHARMPLDRFTALMYPRLTKIWVRKGHTAESMPVKQSVVTARYLKSWKEQADLRLLAAHRAGEYAIAEQEVIKLTQGSFYHDKIPAKFRDVPKENVTVYGPRDTRNYAGQAKLIADTTTELGEATRFEIPDDELERYKLPMPWGVYDVTGKKELALNHIKPEDVTGPGYHWYRLNDVALSNYSYLYFFWSWIIQTDLNLDYDEEKPQQQFEIWANVKFEGPAFPHGKATDKNAISVERMVLVKK